MKPCLALFLLVAAPTCAPAPSTSPTPSPALSVTVVTTPSPTPSPTRAPLPVFSARTFLADVMAGRLAYQVSLVDVLAVLSYHANLDPAYANDPGVALDRTIWIAADPAVATPAVVAPTSSPTPSPAPLFAARVIVSFGQFVADWQQSLVPDVSGLAGLISARNTYSIGAGLLALPADLAATTTSATGRCEFRVEILEQ